MQRTKRSFLNLAFLKGRPAERSGKEHEPAHGGKGGSLERQAVLLLLVHGLFMVGNALSGTFVSVYLWKTKNDFAMIGWFAFFNQIAMAATFWISGKWVKEHNKMNSLRLGTGLAAVFYLAVLLLESRAIHYVAVLGGVQGMSSGFFWVAFNVVYFEVTDPHNRDRFNGWAGLIGAAGGMLAPWLSGFLISRIGDRIGYMTIFSISTGIFVVGVIFSFFLKQRKREGEYSWFYAISHLRDKGNPWRKIVPAMVFQGVREGVFVFLIGLLVYISTGNEMKLGNYTLISSAVAFVSFWITGKLLKQKYRANAILIGTLMLIASIMPLFWQVSYTTLLVFGIGTALFMPLFTVPMTSSVFDFIGKDKDSTNRREEYIVLRELGLCSGRLLGTLVFILVISWRATPLTINLLMLGIGSSFFISALFMQPLLRHSLFTEPGK